MRIRLRYSFLIIAVVMAFAANAQVVINNDTLPGSAYADADNYDTAFIGRPGMLQYDPEKKMTLRMEIGTTFGVGSGNGLFGVYAAPHISYKVNPKLRVNFGAVVRNSNFLSYYNPYSLESTVTFNNNFTQTFVYVEGD